ncbi:MAG: phytanoyl-CoA dioxygenase family protein [Alphaproteobacteria bacterium]|nr:phytanoyl-CoA dioxygenase family protein [Alphaproteobacteria bacterium]
MTVEAVTFDADAAVAAAQSLLDENRYSEAERALRAVLIREPHHVSALWTMASLLSRVALWDESVDTFLTLARAVPQFAEAGYTNALNMRMLAVQERLRGSQGRLAERHLPGKMPPAAGFPPELPIFQASTARLDDMLEAMDKYGCLVIRNLMPRETALQLQDIVRRTYEDCDRALADITAGKAPVSSEFFLATDFTKSDVGTPMFREFGSILMMEAPAATNEFLYNLKKTRAIDLARRYLGSEPYVGVGKSSVRRSEISSKVKRVFHQDATFFGGIGTATINFWVALSDAGIDRPGVQILPHKLDRELVRGQAGTFVGWEIFEETIADLFGLDKLWAPAVEPGDAIVFDQMNVHRTYLTPGMTQDRFAVECWLFPAREKYSTYGLAVV